MDDAILKLRASRCFRIRNPGEGDHGVERQINSWQQSFEQVIEFLFCSKCFRRGFVTHLDEVTDGKIDKGVGFFFVARNIRLFGSTLRPFGRMHRKPLTIRSLVRARPKFDDRMAPPAAAAIIFASSLTVSWDAATGWIREPFPVKDFRL